MVLLQERGASCGAGAASLTPEVLDDGYLKMDITKLVDDAQHLEDEPAENPKERVKSIAKAKKTIYSHILQLQNI
jgi:hypothetical protein